MNSPATDLAKYLGGKPGLGAFGAAVSFGVFAIFEPDEPVNCVTLYDLGGQGDMVDKLDLSQTDIQVRVRCEAYSVGYDIHMIIRDLLRVAPIACEDSTFVGVAMTADPSGIGRDAKNKHVLTATYRAIRNT